MKKFFTLIAVAAMALMAQANTLTVADGLYYSNVSPFCGLYADTYGSLVQQVYPADMLADMKDGKITEVTFYTRANYYIDNDRADEAESWDYINFSGSTIQLAFLETDEAGFTEAVAMTGATVVATVEPERGANLVTFVLDEPFAYTGKNLLVQTLVTVEGSWGQTYFLGDGYDYNTCFYSIDGTEDVSGFLPKATFTYEAAEAPAEKTDAPSSSKENYVYNDGNLYYNAYTVTFTETEPSDIYYRIGIVVDGQVVYGEWMLYTDELNFNEEGSYMVEAYAIAEGKTESDHIWDGFTVSKMVDVEELMAGKTVAGVRYFNMAGQEMQQANGLTIVVTTYTDGTTSTAKVIK